MKKLSKNLKFTAVGAVSGFLNGFFGAGGGTVAVPLLNKCGLSAQSSHATSVVVMLVLSLLSAVMYVMRGDVSITDSLYYIPTGLIGAVVGALCLKKLSVKWIERIFGVVIIIAAVRMFAK